jgi:hypothetical protein
LEKGAGVGTNNFFLCWGEDGGGFIGVDSEEGTEMSIEGGGNENYSSEKLLQVLSTHPKRLPCHGMTGP